MSTTRTDWMPKAPDLARIAAFCDNHGFGILLRRQAERLAAARRLSAARESGFLDQT